MNGEKRKLAGIKRGKKRKSSEILPQTKFNNDLGFGITLKAIDRAIDLLYRRM
jgi:hypothetical protein